MTTLLDTVGREVHNVWNRYVAHRAPRWEPRPESGLGEMLDGPGQRARHYVIAGLIADLSGHAPAVLDVGCGDGTTYAMLRRMEPTYYGVDLSQRAVTRCRERYDADMNASFEVAAFESWEPYRTFDAIILNEMLQRFARRPANKILEKAISHLHGRSSVLVVSFCEQLKSWGVRSRLRALTQPTQRISVTTRAITIFGGRWTVEAYTNLKRDPSHEGCAHELS